MDAAALSALLASSTATLASLHARLGAPPEALAASVEQLRQALQHAVDAQLAHAEQEVRSAEQRCADLQREVAEMYAALGLEESDVMQSKERPLLARLKDLEETLKHLSAEYTSRSQKADALLSQVNAYAPLLGSFMPSVPETPTPASDTAPIPLPASYLAALATALQSAESAHAERTAELRAHLLAILQLWSELCVMPVLSDAAGKPSFQARILGHLRLRVVEPHTADAPWEGAFESLADIGDQTLSPPSSPTTRSRPSGPLAPPSLQPTHALEPHEGHIQAAVALRQSLEQEKTKRELRIQELYDELYALWERFGVPESEMEAFVLANSGATEAAIEAYATELAKMRELKAQHMALFIGGIRERIAALWDELSLSTPERRHAFPAFFDDLDDTGSGVGVAPTDQILAEHEGYEHVARSELERKAPLLRMVAKYRALLEEGLELERAAADKDRLKGKRGRPGALLEEEKTRKRLKTLKPKLEDELLRSIPVWEQETGRPFMIDGARFVEELQAAVGQGSATSKVAAGAKRARTISTSSAASSGPPLSASAQTNRAGSATPMRAVPASTKKARLASGMSNAGSARATPATATRRPPVAGSAARSGVPVSQARLASASQLPPSGAGGAKGSFGFAAATPRAASSTQFKATGFRPRPSAGNVFGGGATIPARVPGKWAGMEAARYPTPGHDAAERHASDHSVAASDATTLIHRSVPAASAPAPRRGPRPSASLADSLAQRTAHGGTAYTRPSMSGAGDAPTIRSVSTTTLLAGEAHGAYVAGPNWAVLDEDEEEAEWDVRTAPHAGHV